jgi:hypothetical protein
VRNCDIGYLYAFAELDSHTNYLFLYLSFQDYKQCFDGAGTNPGEKTLEDKFFEYEVKNQLLLFSYSRLWKMVL